jgi:hypothetical protein
MREVIVDEHYMICSIRPELVHHGEVESLSQSI